MKGQVLICGTGKIAVDWGEYLAFAGLGVLWDAGQSRRDSMEHNAGRLRRRLNRAGCEQVPVGVFDSSRVNRIPCAPDIIIEATTEERAVKQSRLEHLTTVFGTQTPIVSSSSSILPSRLGHGCLGLHPFYPLKLTGFVEFIVPDEAPVETVEAVESFVTLARLAGVRQNERHAFIANRLIVPVQLELLKMAVSGVSIEIVRTISTLGILDMPVLSVMVSVGVSLLKRSVTNYGDIHAASRPQCAALVQVLERWERQDIFSDEKNIVPVNCAAEQKRPSRKKPLNGGWWIWSWAGQNWFLRQPE